MLPWALPIRYFINPKASPSLSFGPRQRAVLNREAHQTAFTEISGWEGYGATPLLSLPGLAASTGVGEVWYKDEGPRFGAGSFKALGGIYGVFRVLQSHLGEVTGNPGLTSHEFAREPYSSILARFTITCASAGNHGRAVAQGARTFGCKAKVFLPAHTSPHRIAAIEALGAETIPVDGSFDDAVAIAAAQAVDQGWSVVADTTYPNYETVPRHIMQGYTVLAREVLEQLRPEALPTHVFLQAGVGGLAAAVTGHLWETLGPQRPRIAVVEPAEADCLLESALMEGRTPSTGSLNSSMEVLACRNVSALAWAILEEGADVFLSIPDTAAEETVTLLEKGLAGDEPLHTQPSGAAGMAGFIAASFEPALASSIGLGKNSRILIIGSEGSA
jgi:diaminopropionate ammonia-lyase